ncbi:MAG: sulfite exporter TauE/SafE family protein [Candidatus Thermoplasmatota archaeon]
MLDSIIEILILVFFAMGVGVFVSTAAGTSGTLLIPFLTIFFGYSAYKVIGSSLTVDCIIGVVAGLIYLKNEDIEIRPTLLLPLFGVIGALIGSQFTSSTPEFGLKVLIGVALIFIGVNFVIKGVRKNVDYLHSKLDFQYFKRHKTFSFVFLGIIVGFISGFIGLGGSRMIAFVLIFVMGYGFRESVGMSMIMMIFIAGTGAISHSLGGEINFIIVVIAGVGAATGALIGSNFAHRIDEEKLSRIAGLIIAFIGLFMIIKTFFL